MKLIRPGEAAKMLGVTTQTLKNMEDRGILTTIRLPGGHRRYKISEIEAILNKEMEG